MSAASFPTDVLALVFAAVQPPSARCWVCLAWDRDRKLPVGECER